MDLPPPGKLELALSKIPIHATSWKTAFPPPTKNVCRQTSAGGGASQKMVLERPLSIVLGVSESKGYMRVSTYNA